MRKIPTLFVRDPVDMSRVTDEVTPGCEWVLAGEGTCTKKYDGTCVMLDTEGRWWARREVKPGKAAPPVWVEADRDDTTGKRPGWEPIEQSPFAKSFTDALNHTPPPLNGKAGPAYPPGTYELCGPKVNGNPEKFLGHLLVRHDDAETFGGTGQPRAAADLRALVAAVGRTGWEGIVWHHPDGKYAKLKYRDLEPSRD